MNSRRLRSGFTLLEVMIAMSILAIGATSILSIFVAAVRFQTDRMEENRVMEIYNVAREHADILFSNFDPSLVEEGQPPFPKPVVADLRDEDKAREHPDPRVRQAARKYRGYKYEIVFERSPFETGGSTVLVQIRVWGLESDADRPRFTHREVLTRTGTPVYEFWHSPSLEQEKNRVSKVDQDAKRRDGRQ